MITYRYMVFEGGGRPPRPMTLRERIDIARKASRWDTPRSRRAALWDAVTWRARHRPVSDWLCLLMLAGLACGMALVLWAGLTR